MSSIASPAAALRRLQDAVGIDALITDGDRLAGLAHDLAGPAEAGPVCAVAPGSVEAMQAVVTIATESGLSVVPRGGGMSYSGGYTPSEDGSVLIDTSRLAAVAEVNGKDRYVNVEAGCTWRTLHQALEGSSLRTPFFGPLSGGVSTVGGAVSQNAVFFGSAAHGSIAGTVIGLEVILADGRLLHTGVLRPGGVDAQPHGPDLTHLFVGDCGTLGVKARIALRLIAAPGAEAFTSMKFDDPSAMLGAQAALAGRPGIGECFGFDCQTHRNILDRRLEFREKVGAVSRMARQPGGLARAARLPVEGLDFLKDAAHSLHVSVEGDDARHAAARSRQVVQALSGRGGTELPNTIPRITRARPFGPITALLGPHGENWLPVHGAVSLSRADACYRAMRAMLTEYSEAMVATNVLCTILTVLSGRAMILEPQFFWPDRLSPFHRAHVTPKQALLYEDAPANARARSLVHDLRKAAIEVFGANGATHMQIGRHYPFGSRLTETQAELMALIRSAVDPERRMNPGVLGTD